MKDQKAILIKCIKNDEPAFVIAGHDACAVEALEAYLTIATKKGAEKAFLEDMRTVIDEMKSFQEQEAHKIRIPSLKENERTKNIRTNL